MSKRCDSAAPASNVTTASIGRRPRESMHADALAAAPAHAPKVSEAARWLERTTAAGVDKLRREFIPVRKYAPAQTTVDAFKKHANHKKNRYGDVKCADATRVKLDGHADYIHASHVTCGHGVRLILTQAPTERTVNDFWRMVWQQRVRTVIMLCEQQQRNGIGTFKCGHYWPAEGKTLASGAYGVAFDRAEVVALQDNQEVHKSTVRLTRSTGGRRKVQEADGGRGEEETRGVLRLRWANWPSGGSGVPSSSAAMVYMQQAVKAGAEEPAAPPVLVHCTAGVGRSGTLALYAAAIERFDAGQPLHMVDVLKQLRAMRLHCVQSEQQYLYVHRCLAERLNDTLVVPMCPAVVGFYLEYERFASKPTSKRHDHEGKEPPSDKADR